MQDFNDILNGVTDGTKDLSINALTCAGTATFNGNVAIGNSSSDTLTVTGSLASDIVPSTDGTRSLGSATYGFLAAYFGDTSGDTVKIIAATLSADRIYTLPEVSADASFLMTAGAQSITGAKTFTVGTVVDGTADEIQLRVQAHSTQTNNVLVLENSSGTDLMTVSGTGASALGATTGGVRHYLYGTYATAISSSGGSVSSGIHTVDAATCSFFYVTATGNFTLEHSNMTTGQVIYVLIAASGADRTITLSASAAWVQASSFIITSAKRALVQITHTGDSYPVMTYTNNLA